MLAIRAAHAAVRLALALAAVAGVASAEAPADLILHGRRVHTRIARDPTPPQASAARQSLKVGTDAEVLKLRGAATTVVPLAGRLALPGFIDAHTHFENAIDWRFRLAPARSRIRTRWRPGFGTRCARAAARDVDHRRRRRRGCGVGCGIAQGAVPASTDPRLAGDRCRDPGQPRDHPPATTWPTSRTPPPCAAPAGGGRLRIRAAGASAGTP